MHRIMKIAILPVALLLNSCGLYNYYKVARVKESSYTVGPTLSQDFSFEIINNRIVVPVIIQGREYNFLFDTGAPLVIDCKLLNEIEYEHVARIKATDSNELGRSLLYIKLSEIKAFESTFNAQGAIVMDLSESVRNSCINISGIFGASVMKDLIWQINFEKQTIRVSDKIENLEVDSHSLKLSFDKNSSQSPMMEVNIDEDKEKLILDTGSGSTFTFSKASRILSSENTIFTAIGTFGGVFGISSDTIRYLKKTIELSPSDSGSWRGVVAVRNGLKEGVVGLGFLKEYLVTIDWINQNLYLKRMVHNHSAWSTYGFSVGKTGQYMIVNTVFQNSMAYEEGLKAGDIINEIDDFNFDNSSETSICDFIESDYLKKVDSSILVKVNDMENYI